MEEAEPSFGLGFIYTLPFLPSNGAFVQDTTQLFVLALLQCLVTVNLSVITKKGNISQENQGKQWGGGFEDTGQTVTLKNLGQTTVIMTEKQAAPSVLRQALSMRLLIIIINTIC